VDETELIREAQQGNLNSFNHLVLAYQDMVFTQAFRILGEEDPAEDATQDAFISAYRNIKFYRGGSFKAWLLRIVTNTCYDELRKQKRRPTQPLEPFDEDEDEIESPKWMADPSESPEDQVQRGELNRVIQHCLDELPPEFRSIVILVDIQGLDYIEAAQAAGKKLGTIKSRLARARFKMRDCLQGFWELMPASIRLMGETKS